MRQTEVSRDQIVKAVLQYWKGTGFLKAGCTSPEAAGLTDEVVSSMCFELSHPPFRAVVPLTARQVSLQNEDGLLKVRTETDPLDCQSE